MRRRGLFAATGSVGFQSQLQQPTLDEDENPADRQSRRLSGATPPSSPSTRLLPHSANDAGSGQ